MKTVTEWISDHTRLILIGQLTTLIALSVLTAIATESLAIYLAIGACGTLLFTSSVSIVLAVWMIGSVKVDNNNKPKKEGK